MEGTLGPEKLLPSNHLSPLDFFLLEKIPLCLWVTSLRFSVTSSPVKFLTDTSA